MSAKARGIILSGDGAELIVQATDADVRRFGQGDVVDVTRRATFAPTPQQWPTVELLSVPESGTLSGSSYMDMQTMSILSSSMTSFAPVSSVGPSASATGNAILHTACGCERRMQVPNPTPPIVRVPLNMPGISYAMTPGPGPTHVNVAIREFAFTHSTGSMWHRTHHYTERT